MIPIESIGIIVGCVVGVSAISGIIVSLYACIFREKKEYNVEKELKTLT
jgi:hypothetical protein